jgi:hypothetical protein
LSIEFDRMMALMMGIAIYLFARVICLIVAPRARAF